MRTRITWKKCIETLEMIVAKYNALYKFLELLCSLVSVKNVWSE